MSKTNTIKATGKENKVIYIYHHPDSKEHEGWLKIGDQTGYNSNRIKDQNEADNIKAETLYMTEAIDKNGKPFRDLEIHAIIDATSQFEREPKKNSKSGLFSEWYRMTKNEAIAAIEARRNLTGFDPDILNKIDISISPREEQHRAIDQTYEYWLSPRQGNREFLWNAKPRFGKTLTSYWFMEKIKAKKVLIVTNRPAISDSWYTDYRQFIQPKGTYKFGSTKDNKHVTTDGNLKGRALNVNETKSAIRSGEPTIFFISLQDIKGKNKDNSDAFKQKNQWIFDETWDLFIIDESHEATETANAQWLFKNLTTDLTLHLSGTPFKALANKKFKSAQIFNWTYEDEQSAKENWDPIDGINPYYELPRMNMFAYRLSNTLNATVGDGEYAFDLNELFRSTQGKFVYEDMVLKFLDNLFGINSKNNQDHRPFPFADTEIRNELKHTFWLLPSVAAVKVLKKLMQDHAINTPSRKIFADYEIIDAADKGDDEHEGKTALQKVKNVIGDGMETLKRKTITLSCGQLTTGITVKPWSAVLMLYGAEGGKTSATKYLQAAFRSQNPWRYTDESGNDMIKENCYVFDFAPDRLLLIFQDYAKSVIGGGEGAETKVKKLLNFLTVVAEDEYGEMKELDANEVVTMPLKLMTQEIVEGKFITSNKLFNIGNIFHLPAGAREILNEMGTIKKGRVDHDKSKNPIAEPQMEYDDNGNLILNESNLGKKKYEELVQDNPDLPTDRPLTVEDLPPSDIKAELEKEAENEQKNQEIEFHDHLRYFARAIPMILMAYGKQDTKLSNFEKYIDTGTFQELVGISKQQFQDLRDKYQLFNEEVFNACIAEFLSRKAKLADYYENDSGLDIFDYIPPQQTNQIYTPKAVVKLMIDSLEKQSPGILKSKDNTFLDPYMKSGLFITEIVKRLYNNLEHQIPDKNQRLQHILMHQVYGFAPSKILHLISSETIFGFMRGRPEFKKVWYQVVKHFVWFGNEDSLVSKSQNALHDKINKEWGKNMKFTAVVGNPPYQEGDGSGGSSDSAVPLYGKFFDTAINIKPRYICLITPSKWMVGGRGLKKFRANMINDKHLSVIVDYENAAECFPGVNIDGGVSYFIWDKDHEGNLEYAYHSKEGDVNKSVRALSNEYFEYVIRDNRVMSIIEKTHLDTRFSDLVSNTRPFGIRNYLFNSPERYPDANLQSAPYDNSLKIHGVKGIKGGAKRIVGYIARDTVTRNINFIDKYKLFFTTSFSTNAIDPPDAIEASPGTVCTETFLVVGPFNNEAEQSNCHKYMRTNFFKVLLYFGKGTMHVTKSVFGLIPVQNYSNNSDIDWAASIGNIDKQLYKKYDLNVDEVGFIEARVKTMD